MSVQHSELVRNLKKNPKHIVADLILNPTKADLIHMVMGIVGEAGELLDAIKKHTIYNKPLDVENIIEELGDLDFYAEGLRQILGLSRDEILAHNIAKLSKRYQDGYSDKAAQERADKK
jgi:NTP pyrophosphatase (non-canonical NTP hydrolase)